MFLKEQRIWLLSAKFYTVNISKWSSNFGASARKSRYNKLGSTTDAFEN